MPDWSIKIIAVKTPKPDLTAQFLPDLSDAGPDNPKPLTVRQGDLVSWNNTTGDEHWPWLVTDQNAPPVDPPPQPGGYLTTSIVKPHDSSDAYYVDVPAGTTLYYCCKCHPAERASIVVVPFGLPTDKPTS
jgi:hypothetical protein